MTDATVNVPSGATYVEALYTPRTLTYEKRTEGGYDVKIRCVTVKSAIIIVFLILMAFWLVPLAFVGCGTSGFRFNFFNGLIGALVVCAVFVGLGIGAYRKFSPTMTITADGVQIKKRFYAIQDIQDFRAHSDDWWVFSLIKVFKLDALGISYGIYSLHTPYILSDVEGDKVAIFLTKLLKSLAPAPGANRDLKIQQADEF